jgi:1,4-alpha-glucan branching enzyme
LVGDFNDWDSAATPAKRQADGSWTTWVQLRPGRHVYSFVIDGTHFVSDPAAPIAPDDGYGQRNSVVVVAGASS